MKVLGQFAWKPYMPGAEVQYNLSDSGDRILIAVSRQAVGIDVEYVKPKFYYDTILPLNFTQEEIDFISGGDSSNRFFMLWTRKEAILKATGIHFMSACCFYLKALIIFRANTLSKI